VRRPGAALQKSAYEALLASIAKCVATLVARFTRLAKVSPPVLDRTESGTGRLRLRLSTS